MNTDIMYGNKPLYAYVMLKSCCRIAIPLYRRNQHIQFKCHQKIRFECYSEEEVSWYRNIGARLKCRIRCIKIEYIDNSH